MVKHIAIWCIFVEKMEHFIVFKELLWYVNWLYVVQPYKGYLCSLAKILHICTHSL